MMPEKKKEVSDTVEFYRRGEVVKTFEADRDSAPKGRLRWELQTEMMLDLLAGPEDPLLEIAGGTGRFSRQFARAGRELFVFDASREMICSNRAGLEKEGKVVPFTQGLAQQLPFKSASFGTVFCVDMFSHIADPEPIIREMARVLRPGGQLIINFTNKSSLMGLGAGFISNPLRRLLGKMEVFSTYHWSGRFLKMMDEAGLWRLRTTGLFFIDPRLYRFGFGRKFFTFAKKMENWMSRRDCRFLYEQIWIKAIRQ